MSGKRGYGNVSPQDYTGWRHKQMLLARDKELEAEKQRQDMLRGQVKADEVWDDRYVWDYVHGSPTFGQKILDPSYEQEEDLLEALESAEWEREELAKELAELRARVAQNGHAYSGSEDVITDGQVSDSSELADTTVCEAG